MGSTQARNYHSITIGSKNTWDDWHLIPTSRPEFVAPNSRTAFVDIPGSSMGVMDITEINIKHPVFENRKGSFQFIVAPGYGEWYERYEAIRFYLHGKRFRAVLDDEPTYFYEGRFTIKPWASGKEWSTVTIDYNVGPYKWETLIDYPDYNDKPIIINAENDFPYHNYSYVVNGQKTVNLTNAMAVYSPYITTTAQMECTLNGERFTLPKGKSRNPLMVLNEGANTYIFHGTGTVTIHHRGGIL